MAYPRTASIRPSLKSQPSDRGSSRLEYRPSQLPVRSRTTTTTHTATNYSASATTARPNLPLQLPEAAFLDRYKSIFSKKVAAWIGVGTIALSLLAVVPFRVGSESIDLSSCEKKIKPTGQISRGQMSALLALPMGATEEAVRRVVDEPYCTLPAISKTTATAKSESERAIVGAQREAYPLAFDPEAWVVIAYSDAGEYLGYDFVFKP